MRRLWFFLLFIAALSAGLFINKLNSNYDVYRAICDTTEDHFYRDDERLRQWLERCHLRASKISPFASADRLLFDIQNLMSEMQTSHFQIYNPVDDRRLWKGQSLDTGIRSRYIEDHLVIYRELNSSSAEAAGVRAGDEILRIPDAEQITPWGAQHHAGRFELQRAGRPLEVQLQPRELTVDSSPKVTHLPGNVGLVELSSFRSEFFERKAWQKFAQGLMPYSRLVIDVRDNSGGNFVAMLRALSTFLCGGKSAGILLQPRKQFPGKNGFDDNTSDQYQMQELEQHRSVNLLTFADYGCYSKPVTVLIGPDTASVAEIFAYGFLHRPGGRVWGQPTAGDVLLAVWFDLDILGEGYNFSIPEAMYLTPDHKQLEGEGVFPQQELYHDLKTSLRGEDIWITKAQH
jgi:carboxyl-terminal processing protease